MAGVGTAPDTVGAVVGAETGGATFGFGAVDTGVAVGLAGVAETPHVIVLGVPTPVLAVPAALVGACCGAITGAVAGAQEVQKEAFTGVVAGAGAQLIPKDA